MKQGISIGRTNNQNFVSIPFYKLRRMLEYKCKQVGIHYIETEESYTSKRSFLDMKDMCKQSVYKGNRTHRGLFVDSNGSLNIIRKVAGNAYFVYQNTSDLVEDYVVSPLKVTIY